MESIHFTGLYREDKVDSESESKPKNHRKGGRKGLPKDLPREKIIHELKKEELQCKCGSELVHIGSDISEQLDIIPATMFTMTKGKIGISLKVSM